MNKDFKDIFIGKWIQQRVSECEVEISRICKFLKATEDEVSRMYQSKNLPSDLLLQWSKLLEYDFFRIYSQHLILYSPPGPRKKIEKEKKSTMPSFRKHIYTMEIIYFFLELIKKGHKTRRQIIEEYRIPKTTLYKWIEKYDQDQ